MGIYDADGKIRLTVVDGNTRTGLYAPDGSWNVVLDPPGESGIYHPSGAFNATFAGNSSYYSPEGFLNLDRNAFGPVNEWVLRDDNDEPFLVDLDFDNSRFWVNGTLYTTVADVPNLTDNADGTYTFGPVNNLPFPGFSLTAGTVVSEHTKTDATAGNIAWTIQETANNNNCWLNIASTAGNRNQIDTRRGGIATSSMLSPVGFPLTDKRIRVCATAQENDYTLHGLGEQYENSPDTAGLMPNWATDIAAMIGHRSGGNLLVGTTHRWAYTPSAVSADRQAELSMLTNMVAVGAWTWFNDPRVVVGENGEAIIVAAHRSLWTIQESGKAPFYLRDGGAVNDHNIASPLRRSLDNRYITHYAGHRVSAESYQRISTNVDDITAWEAETDVGTSYGGFGLMEYSNLIELTSGIYHFGKMDLLEAGNRHGVYSSVSTDNGATWSAKQDLFFNPSDAGNGPFWKMWQSGPNRIDCIVTNGAPQLATISMYYCYFDGTNWRDRDDNILSLPIDPSTDLTGTSVIWDGVTAGTKAHVWQIVNDTDGTPVVVFAHFPTPETDHRYMYGRWNGTSWDVEEICTAGASMLPATQPFYSGGICIDPDNVNVIYCSREDVNGDFQIWKGVNGATWTMTQLTDTPEINMRPYKPSGLNKVFYPSGIYTGFATFDMVIKEIAV